MLPKFGLSRKKEAVEQRNKFLAWLEKEYPELYSQYSRNVDIPLVHGRKMTINNINISITAREQLIKVLKLYYHLMENPS